MNQNKLIPVSIALVFIALLLWSSRELVTVLIFIPGVIAVLIYVLSTSHRKAPDPSKVLPLYIIALAIQMIHFAEEYLTDFEIRAGEVFGTPPFDLDFWVGFNMVAYAIFIMGAIVLYKGIKSLLIVPITFIILAVMINLVGHIGLCIYVGGYFPGLFTALLYLLIAPRLIPLIFSAPVPK